MSFANPELLFLLLLLAIPIVIHLFNFKKYKRFYFTNLRFLTDIKNETKRQSTVKRYLILATRMLFIISLVMAFAKPYIPFDSVNIDSTKGNLVSIYVDNSFSMEGEISEGVALEIAKKDARQVVESYGIDDRFQIITNEFNGYQQRSYSKAEALNMIDEIVISSYSRQLDEIVERQGFVLNKENYANRISYLISDFQKGMISETSNVSFDTLTNYNFIRINSDKVDNVYIDSCWFSSPIHNMFDVVHLNVKIVNVSKDAREQIPLKMFVNGEQRAITNCDVEANGETVVTISYSEKEAGLKSCYLELTDYPIIYDDRLYFSYNVTDVFNVVVINDNLPNKYLEAAFGRDSIFNYVNYSAKQTINYEHIHVSNVVILDGAILSSGLTSELKKFVENGGTLVVFPARGMDINSYNHLLKQLNVGYYSTDGEILKENRITDIAFDSKIYKDIFNDKPDKMDLPLVNLWYKIETPIQNPGEQLLKMINSDMFLTNFRNNVYLFSTPLDSEFSTFPIHSIFIPTMFNIVINSVSQNGIYSTCGETSCIHNITDRRLLNSKEVLKLISYDGKLDYIPQQNDIMNKRVLSFVELDIPVGNYVIKYDNENIDGISINYDRKESLLDFYDNDELLSLNNSSVRIIDGIKVIKDDIRENFNDSSLPTILIILALLLLLTESLIIRFIRN